MPILDVQKRFRELGRLRMGRTVPTSGGKTRPAKLDTWRLTSKSRHIIDRAAELWGGTVTEWEDQWEVITEAKAIAIVLPPDPVTQWYELWSGGGCQRRCDGVEEMLTGTACVCDPDNRECNPTTRLNVIVPELNDIGVFRLETHGYYAAVELGAIGELIGGSRGMIPATLRLEPRQVKRPGEPRKDFVVPVVEFDVEFGKVLEAIGPAPALARGDAGVQPTERPALPQSPSPIAGEEERVPPTPPPPPSPSVNDEEELWHALMLHLDGEPDDTATMEVNEDAVRSLFGLMVNVDLWHDGEHKDALHLALDKRGARHVGDLKAAQLRQFRKEAFDAARQKVRLASVAPSGQVGEDLTHDEDTPPADN